MKKIDIENPCSISWDEMQDLGKDKFCQRCNKTVLDLDLKNEVEIVSLLIENPKLCGAKFSKFNIAKV